MAAEKFTPDQVIDAARKARGVVAVSARILGCTRNTVMRYRDTYDEVRAAFEEANEAELDEAENTLTDFVRGLVDGAGPRERLDALKFYLRTKGRQRGYGDRMEVAGDTDNPLVVYWPGQKEKGK